MKPYLPPTVKDYVEELEKRSVDPLLQPSYIVDLRYKQALKDTHSELQDILARLPYLGAVGPEGVIERLENLKRDLEYELQR